MKTKEEFRKEVADGFIALLKENDNKPFINAWDNAAGRPTSAATGKPYTGLNFMQLLMEQSKKKYNDNRWYTFAAIKVLNKDLVERAEAEGKDLSWEEQIHLRKGSKGVTIHDTFPERAEKDKETGEWKYERVSWRKYFEETSKLPEGVFYDIKGRTITVFNGDQIANLPRQKEKVNDFDYAEMLLCREIVEGIARNMGVILKHDDYSNSAYYIADFDCVVLPPVSSFKSEASYYAVALHELAHATGHKKRLNRFPERMDINDRAKEELVAEITSAMMGLYAKDEWIDDKYFENQKAYVQVYIKNIEDKPIFLEDAIRLAFKASDYLDSMINLELVKERVSEQEAELVQERIRDAQYRLNGQDLEYSDMNDEILGMSNESKDLRKEIEMTEQKKEYVYINMPKWAVGKSYKSNFDPEKEFVSVRIPNREGDFGKVNHSFAIGKERIRDDVNHENRCYIVMKPDRDVTITRSFFDAATKEWVVDGKDIWKPQEIKDAFVANYSKYKDRQAEKEYDPELDVALEPEQELEQTQTQKVIM